jgi:Fur family transcriptional regulator, ferric uptake regulator
MTTRHREDEQPPRTEADAVARLRTHGARLTPSRREVVHHFFAQDSSITVDELLVLFPIFDPATLYRTVNALEQHGIIEHTHLGHGAATYRRAGADTIAMVCQRCSHTIAIPRNYFRSLATKVQSRHGFHINLGHFAVTGTCAACVDPSNTRASGT